MLYRPSAGAADADTFFILIPVDSAWLLTRLCRAFFVSVCRTIFTNAVATGSYFNNMDNVSEAWPPRRRIWGGGGVQ